MGRSSKKTKPLTGHDDRKVSLRTDLNPQTVLDPNTESAIEAELTKLGELKKSGETKPTEVTWGDWMGPKKMKPQFYVIANLMAFGMRPAEICQQTGLTSARMSVLASNSLIKAYVAKLQAYYTHDAKKRFDNLIPKAVSVFEEVLDPLSQSAEKLKVDVAGKVFDRAWGRSAGEVTDAGGTVLNLLRGLKELNQSAHGDPIASAIDITPNPTAPIVNQPEEEATDDGSVSGLLNTWDEGNNGDSNGKEEDGETSASEEEN